LSSEVGAGARLDLPVRSGQEIELRTLSSAGAAGFYTS